MILPVLLNISFPFAARSAVQILSFRRREYLLSTTNEVRSTHKLVRQLVVSLLFIGFFFPVHAVGSLRISLLSCSPGEELYSIFGHSAFRVRDSLTGLDKVYNYGTFNFGEKNFYLKFMSGKLNYYLSTQSYPDFISDYQAENRSVYEQVFNFSEEQALQLYRGLELNMVPQNRAYKYDFFWDNCSTRIRDKVEGSLSGSIQYPATPPLTFRDYLHKYLVPQPWSELGIDLILGLPADKKTTAREAMFLPMEMMYVYDETLVAGVNICSPSENIIPAQARPYQPGIFHPKWVLLALLILTILLYRFTLNTFLFRIYAGVFFLVIGLGGLVIGFLWFIADHTTTDLNLHFIWANPLCLLYPIRKKIFSVIWLKRLTVIYALGLLFMIFGILFLPQALPLTCIPLWVSLLVILLTDLQRK